MKAPADLPRFKPSEDTLARMTPEGRARLEAQMAADDAAPAPSPASVVVLSEADKARIRRAALLADKGPWRYNPHTSHVNRGYGKKVRSVVFTGVDESKRWDENGEYIADANPLAVLALLDENTRLQAEVNSARIVVEGTADLLKSANSESAALREELASVRQEVAGLKACIEFAGPMLLAVESSMQHEKQRYHEERLGTVICRLGLREEPDSGEDECDETDLPAALPQLGDIAEEGGVSNG